MNYEAPHYAIFSILLLIPLTELVNECILYLTKHHAMNRYLLV